MIEFKRDEEASMKKVYCKNCKWNGWECSTEKGYASNCKFYERKWWKFWVERSMKKTSIAKILNKESRG